MADFKDLDRLLQNYVDRGLPGCACLIARKGEILYENYFGYANLEKGEVLTAEHVFRQASLTKIALYTTLMMLYERGRFLMTDPLYEYFPEYRHSAKVVRRPDGEVDIVPTDHPITVKQIMNMTCGLPYDMFLGDVNAWHPTSIAMFEAMKPLREKGFYTLREQIHAMAEVPLAFEPGSRFLYGFASELAAGMLEVLEDKPAGLVIKELLFEPLGMDCSANFLFGDLGERLVGNYYLRDGRNLGEEDALYIPEEKVEVKSVGPLGSVSGFPRVITNCHDYNKLMQMLANGGVHQGNRIIGHGTIDLIRTNTLTPKMIEEDFSNTYLAGYGYGYGMRMLLDPYTGQHNGSLGAFGWTGGSGTWAEADPSTGTSIVYMHNLQPNLEEYHHLRMRAAAYGCLD